MKTLRTLAAVASLFLALLEESHAATGLRLVDMNETNNAASTNWFYTVGGAGLGADWKISYTNALEALKQLQNWNAEQTALVAGVGGALTNVTLLAYQTDRYINGFTNVSIRAVMGSVAGRPNYWNVTITNGSGTDRTIEFSVVTNRYRFQGTYGTNAPSVLTNGTQLLVSGRSDGTNTLLSYAYYAWP